MQQIKVTDVRCEKGDSAFLLDDGKTAILCDTGFGFTGYRIAERIQKVLGSRKLDAIFLTHSHYDHALATPYILRHYPDAMVVAGRYAAEVFQRPGAKRTMQRLDREFAVRCGAADYEFLGDELKVDLAVDDGDTVTVGDMTFTVLNLPGHTKCSVGYYCREASLLLGSETLGVYDGDQTILPCYLVSFGDTLKSIDRIAALQPKLILAPHVGILSPEQTDFFLHHMKSAAEDTAQDYLRLLREGKTTEQIIDAFKARYWHGYVREIYPEDALELNVSIMAEQIRKELC